MNERYKEETADGINLAGVGLGGIVSVLAGAKEVCLHMVAGLHDLL